MKRTHEAMIATAAVAAILAIPSAAGAEQEWEEEATGDPHIVGHRGAAGTSPENTMAGVRDARASGSDVVEVDVQLSADNVPILFHDATGARTTDVAEVFPDRASDPITSFTWAELQLLDAGEFFSQRYDGEPIPHLNDAADTVAGSPMSVNIEIKSPEDSPGIEAVLAEELATGPGWQRLIARDQVVVSSFEESSLVTFHGLAPDIPLLQIGGIPDDATLERWATFADGVVTNYRTLDPADIDRVRAHDLSIGLYTVNSPETMQAAIDLGVDEIITDFPRALDRLLAGRDPLPQGNGIVVASIEADPAGSDLQPENGEYVELLNTTHRSIDVSGYLLQDAVINRLVVGEGYTMAPGATLRVYTGPGTNTEDRYYNDFGRNVLNNTGDSIAVFTPQLRLLDLYAY